MYPGLYTDSTLDVAKRFAIVLTLFAAITGASMLGSVSAVSPPADYEIIADACFKRDRSMVETPQQPAARTSQTPSRPRLSAQPVACSRLKG